MNKSSVIVREGAVNHSRVTLVSVIAFVDYRIQRTDQREVWFRAKFRIRFTQWPNMILFSLLNEKWDDSQVVRKESYPEMDTREVENRMKFNTVVSRNKFQLKELSFNEMHRNTVAVITHAVMNCRTRSISVRFPVNYVSQPREKFKNFFFEFDDFHARRAESWEWKWAAEYSNW